MNFKKFVMQEDWRGQLNDIDRLIGRLANNPSAIDIFDFADDENGRPEIVGLKDTVTPQHLQELLTHYCDIDKQRSPRIAAMIMQKIKRNIKPKDADPPNDTPDEFRFHKPEDERVSY